MKWGSMRGLITSSVTLAALCACASIPPVPAVSVESLDDDVRTAIQSARDAALAQPKSGEASGHMGMVLQVHELYPPALLAYQRAIRLAPKEFAWRYYQALSLEKTFQLEPALAGINAALRLQPEYIPAVLKRSQLLFKLGRFREADSALGPSLAQYPNSAPILYEMARIKFAEQDFQASEDLYRRACEAFPLYGSAWLGLAEAGRRLGHSADLAAYLQKA